MPYADKQKQREYQRRWNKEHYRENRNQERERIQKRKAQIGIWFQDFKRGLICETCGESDPACLDFHHTEKDEKDFTLALVKSWGWGRERILREVAKCQVLCANCHRKKHSKNN
jgi:2-keto-3-deoxy-L-rhamnonate aldolase RhmA